MTLVAVSLALFIFGLFYAALTRYLRRRDPNHGYVAILVVGGNAAILAGYAYLAGLNQALILLLLMAAAGLPMIAEYVDDHLSAQQRQRMTDQIQHLMRED